MEFELWLFAIKKLAQNYDVAQIIYDNMPQDEKRKLRNEYEAQMGKSKAVSQPAAPAPASANMDMVLADMVKTTGTIKSWLNKSRRFERTANALMNSTTDADQIFKARMVMSFMELLEKMDRVLEHLTKPVREEGQLHLTASNILALNRTVMTEGTLVEFVVGSQWKIGYITLNREWGYYQIISIPEREMYSRLEGVYVRIR